MNATRDHYETLLAKHYSRGMGGFEARAADSAAFFARHGLTPKQSGRAADLGAGPGFQSIPLARAGFSVTAVDFSPTLLAELAGRAGGLEIDTVQGDIMDLDALLEKPVELASCIGDTLSNLASLEAVGVFFNKVHGALEEDGLLALGFRDQERSLEGTDRFLPVHSDDAFIFTCFLEYGEAHIDVTDLVYTLSGSGWVLEKSAYRKVRLMRGAVAGMLEAAGFRLESDEISRGMVSMIARKI